MKNIVMDALATIKSLHLARSSVLHESMRSSVVVAQAAAHRPIDRKPLREATMRLLQSTRTSNVFNEVDVSRRGAGRT